MNLRGLKGMVMWELLFGDSGGVIGALLGGQTWARIGAGVGIVTGIFAYSLFAINHSRQEAA